MSYSALEDEIELNSHHATPQNIALINNTSANNNVNNPWDNAIIISNQIFVTNKADKK